MQVSVIVSNVMQNIVEIEDYWNPHTFFLIINNTEIVFLHVWVYGSPQWPSSLKVHINIKAQDKVS